MPLEVAYGAVALLGLGLCLFIAFWRAEQAAGERLAAENAALRAERDRLTADNATLLDTLRRREPSLPFLAPRATARVYGETLRLTSGGPRA